MTLDVANDNNLIPQEPDPGRDGPIVRAGVPWLPHIMHNLCGADILYNFRTKVFQFFIYFQFPDRLKIIFGEASRGCMIE